MRFQLVPLFLVVLSFVSPTVTASEDHTHTAHAPRGIWKEFVELKAGNSRFVAGRAKIHNRQAEHAPRTVVLSCSDAPLPPEAIFDQSYGQMLSLRAIGASLDASVVASIEHAIEKMGAKVLVVLGHDSCGVLKTAMTSSAEHKTGSADMDAVMASIRPRIAHQRSVAYVDDALRGPARANVQGVVADLMKRSQIVREAVERNHLLIAQALYTHDNGQVEFWEAGHPGASHDDTELDRLDEAPAKN